MQRVLICDDDVELCGLLTDYLSRQGLTVETLHSAEAAIARLSRAGDAPDVLVLDVMLPGIDGLAALRRIRERHGLPILMLSARGEPVDRVLGLELGADDYLAKPCLPRELLARIQALLRRGAPLEAAEVGVGTLLLKPAQRSALLDGRPLELTGAEFSVLLELTRNAGQIVSRERLTERGLHRPLERHDRAIDVHVSRLRQKLAAAGTALRLESVRGAGYILHRPEPGATQS